MATAGTLGFGSKIKVGDGASPEQFTDIAEARSIDVTPLTQEFTDATSMDSAGGYREVIPTIKDANNVAVELIGTSANITQLAGFAAANTLKNYQITLPAPVTKTYSFAAYLESWGTSVPVDDLISVSAEFRISGPVQVA